MRKHVLISVHVCRSILLMPCATLYRVRRHFDVNDTLLRFNDSEY